MAVEPGDDRTTAARRAQFRSRTGDRTAIRDAIIGRVGRNVAMIRQLAEGGEPTFQRMLPWAADLERSGNEVAKLPDEFW
jgi:hypothetical protein